MTKMRLNHRKNRNQFSIRKPISHSKYALDLVPYEDFPNSTLKNSKKAY